MEQSILLDPSIRDWVLLPLIAIVLFFGVLRHYATLLLTSPVPPVMKEAKLSNTANYTRLLLQMGTHLPPSSFHDRAVDMVEGPLTTKSEVSNPMEMMSDPNMMSNMLKSQMMNMVPNIGMMMLVSYFFSGFVVAKFPFPLSKRFAGMMQRGLENDDLQCNYVTSLSLYFLIQSGCQGLLQLFLGQDAEVNDQMAMMMQAPRGQPVDYNKVYAQLSEELLFVKDRHKWTYQTAPATLLANWKPTKRSRQASARNH